MRIVPGLRDLDDYPGLPGRYTGARAHLLSFLMMSVISLVASLGALVFVRETLDRALGADNVTRALQDLDPHDSELFGLLNADWTSNSTGVRYRISEPFAAERRAFGRRETPPPEPETSVALTHFVAQDTTVAGISEPGRVFAGGIVEAPHVLPEGASQLAGTDAQAM